MINDCSFSKQDALTATHEFEKILILYNPISSAGNTAELAGDFEDFFIKQHFSVLIYETAKKMKSYQRIAADIAASNLIVIIGGDGTVRKLLPLLSQTRKPVYVVPGGNESLIARSYGMTTQCTDLLQAMTTGKYLEQYYGLISGEGIQGKKPFFIMASMGFDSLTIKRIGKRKGPINDAAYVWCGLNALVSLHHPVVSVIVDGNTVIDQQSGYLIVANSSAYARNLQLVPEANPSNKELVLGFLPKAKHQHELIKLTRMMQHKPAGLPLQYFSGNQIALTLHYPSYPLQVDGDYFRNRDIQVGTTIEFSIHPEPIRVLVPPGYCIQSTAIKSA
ncbi:MAG: diacylglycerol kinase [Nitrosomonas sp.]|nr:diacylglycerol kinase [Nitrosomonas sp.]